MSDHILNAINNFTTDSVVKSIINSENPRQHACKDWLIEQTENYVAKLMHINPNQRMSLQLHQKKEETIYVNSGTLAVWESKNDEDFKLFNPGSVYHVKPGMVHRFGAKDKAVNLIEVSTNYLEDVVRIADDYKR